MTIQAGQNLLHYHLVEKIGQGGRCAVWKALDMNLSRRSPSRCCHNTPPLMPNGGSGSSAKQIMRQRPYHD